MACGSAGKGQRAVQIAKVPRRAAAVQSQRDRWEVPVLAARGFSTFVSAQSAPSHQVEKRISNLYSHFKAGSSSSPPIVAFGG